MTALLAARAAFCSPPDACSLTSTATDAKLTLSLADARTTYHEGEIIPLVLSFTSTGEKRYLAADRNYDRSGRLDIDTYCLNPTVRDPLADYFFGGLGGGIGGERQLSEKPFTVTAELNEWRQPGPGHYRLWVLTNRVSGELSSLETGRAPVRLRSNTIEFDVIQADAASSANQLREVTATYQNATGDKQKEAARRLRFLSTKESADTLAQLFWSLNGQPAGWDLMFGLFGSPHRAEAVAAMRREINTADHPITQDFLSVFTELQIVGQAPPLDPATYGGNLQSWQDSWEKMGERASELKKAALTATVAALPQKAGRARALTLEALATEKSDLLDRQTASQMRKQLIVEWGSLPDETRQALILGRWPPLAEPEGLPILRELVSSPAPHFGNEGSFACYGLTPSQCSIVMSRNAALKHIYDLNPVEGRSLILRDLRDPKAQPSISLVKLLSSAELRPIVQQAVQRIATSDGRPWDYSIVELFADKSALRSLEAKFKGDTDHLPKGMCIPYAVPMLRYFLRVDPQLGARVVQESLDGRKVTGCYQTLLEDLGNSLPAVEQLAISNLDDADLNVSTSAARALGRWGTAKAEPALWARLKRFHEEWPNGVFGSALIDRDTSAQMHALDNLERALIDSIVSGTHWMCGPEKFVRLRPLVSPQHRMEFSAWTEEWEEGQPWILNPDWGPEDQLTFRVLQYSNLDEQEIRTKLSQMPRGAKLYFQTYTAEQMDRP